MSMFLLNRSARKVLTVDKLDWLYVDFGTEFRDGAAIVEGYLQGRAELGGRPGTGWRDGGLTHEPVAAWVEEHGPAVFGCDEGPDDGCWLDGDEVKPGWALWNLGNGAELVADRRGERPVIEQLMPADWLWLYDPPTDCAVFIHPLGLWFVAGADLIRDLPRSVAELVAGAIDQAVRGLATGRHNIEVGREGDGAFYARVVPWVPLPSIAREP